MRKSLLFFISAVAVFTACAKNNYVPERNDYSFKSRVTVVCDEDDDQWCHADSIIVYLTDAKGHIDSLVTEAQPLDTINWQGFGGINQFDINFDGYPDLQVCQGPVNMFGNFTYTAYLWDQANHGFVKVPGYDEIFDPTLDEEKKQIVGTWRLDNDVTITTYGWKDGKLVEISSEDLKYDEPFE